MENNSDKAAIGEMRKIISGLGLDDRLRSNNIRRYALQCGLAAVVVLILLMVLDEVTQTVLIAALGATTFIAFAVPRSLHSSPRCLVGGYVFGVIAGTSMATIEHSIALQEYLSPHASVVLFGALAMGLAMFLMVVTKTEHPPAAALALGLVLNEWSALTIVVIISGVIAISIIKRLVLPLLMDLL